MPIAVEARRGREKQKRSRGVTAAPGLPEGRGAGEVVHQTRSPKRVSGRHIKTRSLWTAPHTAVQRPSPPASSWMLTGEAAEVQLSKMINRIISWGGGGQALIVHRITLGLLILTHSPAREHQKSRSHCPDKRCFAPSCWLNLPMILPWT